ncbi:hypothetical protein NM688_g5507 [Phlebia brevispora]|uniref:Uncharacterized protein n=1 Tax=Phlebia brevispora TaxID=194682 RepID=A0ACC1SUS9_9APHY|nr:hypothetical protein NM688_g5507 [Phlebia brevispora]
MICRHDIPLLVANVDTPGERQKYVIAAVEWLFELIPPHATVGILYDIGCTTHRSVQLYPFLPDSVTDRIQWATSAMHAYGHQWACQLVYAPRFQNGLGHTDGEGVERLWSKLRVIISVSRTSGRWKRLWLVDRHIQAIGETGLSDLGTNIDRRLRRAGEQAAANLEALRSCEVEEIELRRQWQLQKDEQTSVQSHAPARLKKDLHAILTLQAEVDRLEDVISSTQTSLKNVDFARSSGGMPDLAKLKQTQLAFASQVEALYASVNVDYLPGVLRNHPLEFVHMLVLAREQKISLRSRLNSHFHEWALLDQAAGGRDLAIGTKAHQETRKKIAKRKPTIVSGLKRYNERCGKLRDLRPSWSRFPIPSPLPIDFVALRDDARLMEDVWIDPSGDAEAPRWLEDMEVRNGITAMHKYDRAIDEKKRCSEEAENMCRWFGLELTAIEVAIRLPQNAPYLHLLHARREQHLLRRHGWRTSLVSRFRYDYHLRSSVEVADAICGIHHPLPLQWLAPSVLPEGFLAMEDEEIDADGYDLGDDDAECSDLKKTLIADFMEDRLEKDTIDDVLDILSQPSVPADEESDSDSDVFVPPSPTRRAYRPGPDKKSVAYSGLSIGETSCQWVLPRPYATHTFPELFSTCWIPIPAAEISRPRSSKLDGHQIHFSIDDIARLSNPDGWLNDVCINGCALVLRHFYGIPSRLCALFSTYAITCVRKQNLDSLKRSIARLRWQESDVWLIPIHQEHRKHWTMVAVLISTKTIYHFDSFAEEACWLEDINDTMRLLKFLHGEDSAMPLDGWSAYPLSITPHQTNEHDCGLWVLATMLAFLKGYEMTGLSEVDMPKFRHYLLNLIARL